MKKCAPIHSHNTPSLFPVRFKFSFSPGLSFSFSCLAKIYFATLTSLSTLSFFVVPLLAMTTTRETKTHYNFNTINTINNLNPKTLKGILIKTHKAQQSEKLQHIQEAIAWLPLPSTTLSHPQCSQASTQAYNQELVCLEPRGQEIHLCP